MVQLDKRYSIVLEFCGYVNPQYVVRFCDTFLGSKERKEDARQIAFAHRRQFLALCSDLQTIGTGEKKPTSYKVVELSTAHLTEVAAQYLESEALANNPMILQREYGFFVKLFEDLEDNQRDDENLNKLVCWAHSEGYRMIEFDRDVPILSQFTSYNW